MDKEDLGFGGSFSTYRKLTVDNGTDTTGAGATGAYVIKSFKDGKVVRDMFAPTFDAVILLSRAQLVEKGKTVTWRTSEFNPLKKEAKIPVLAISEGKPIKDAEGNYKVAFDTIDAIKEKMSYTTPKGVERTYNYLIVLYLLLTDTNEVVKLVFKGTGRKNYYSYMNQLAARGKAPFDVLTTFGIAIDEYSKYVVTMKMSESETYIDPHAVLAAQEKIIGEGNTINLSYVKSYNNLLGAAKAGVAPVTPLPVSPLPSEDVISEDEIPFEG